MDIKKAFRAGVFGALIVTLLAALGRLFIIAPMNPEMTWARALTHSSNFWAWLLGFGLHLIHGGAIGLIYAWCFEHISHRSNAMLGLVYAAVHALIAGSFFYFFPASNSILLEATQTPDFYGWPAVAMFVGLHLAFGAFVGNAYTTRYRNRPGFFKDSSGFRR